ncbi:hypothetical protein ACHAWF_010305 [Thalassiosira exigua]
MKSLCRGRAAATLPISTSLLLPSLLLLLTSPDPAAAAVTLSNIEQKAEPEPIFERTKKLPNIIIIQPDDMPFYDAWWYPNPPSSNNGLPNAGLPHIEFLRTNGMQMMQAYTTGPMCGTSRYSTITSRYPSRALTNDEDEPSWVAIMSTKLEGNDCTRNNLAVQFRDGGYRTAMVGKWHLSYIDASTYTYDKAVETVNSCGFDYVGGLYAENLRHSYNDGSFSHNMEWLTTEALKVIKEESEEPFFLYFNPTVLHKRHDIGDSLRDFSCRDTPAGTLDADPVIPGMTDGGDCESYRQTVFARAEDDNDLGAIWLDDSIGAILKSLRDTGKLENTVIVFQADHGMDPKASLFEGGTRIPQFIHYPAAIKSGMKFNAPVSVLDLGPTLLDLQILHHLTNRMACLGKMLLANNRQLPGIIDVCFMSTNTTAPLGIEYEFSTSKQNMFDLCSDMGNYDFGNWKETSNLINGETSVVADMESLITCHLKRIQNQQFSPCQLPSNTSQSSANPESVSFLPIPDDFMNQPMDKPTRSPSATPEGRNDDVSGAVATPSGGSATIPRLLSTAAVLIVLFLI